MSENYHYVQLTVESGELHRAFVCTAPADADCRRRPADWEDRESWPPSETDAPGFPCWAVEFVNDAGIEDALYAHPDGVLASVLVSIRYADCVEITPTLADQGKPQITDDGHETDVVCGNCGCGIGIDDEMVERGARALAGRRYGLRAANTDNPQDYRDARAVLEAALGGEA